MVIHIDHTTMHELHKQRDIFSFFFLFCLFGENIESIIIVGSRIVADIELQHFFFISLERCVFSFH